MINLRYHIVSITAVFLALGIGLTLGSTFLDRVTVDTLKSQLDSVQERVDATEAENNDLASRLTALDERDSELASDLAERLVEGHLEGVPVLLVVSDGTDQQMVEQTIGTLRGAGADVAGAWWLTERWALDDSEEVSQLAEVLEIDSDDAARLRRSASIQLASALLESARPAPEEAPEGGEEEPAEETESDGDPAATETAAPVEPIEPEIAGSLEATGFIEYSDVPAGGDSPLLPASGVRYLFLAGSEPAAGASLMEMALLEELAADGTSPVVVAQGQVDIETAEGEPAPEEARRTTFVGPVREGELTGQWVSTVDTLDVAAGQAAVVLALEDLAVPDLAEAQVGHYGVGPGASRLLPGPSAAAAP